MLNMFFNAALAACMFVAIAAAFILLIGAGVYFGAFVVNDGASEGIVNAVALATAFATGALWQKLKLKD